MRVPAHSPIVAALAEAPLLAELKRRARKTWAAGDYAEIARRELWPLGEHVVARIGVGPGEDVLDVACGTGNAALRAAGAGARVVALDLTPELLDTGRALAATAGLEIDWVEGDAEALPFADESFDVVLSTLGVMFAPRHRVAAAELARVLRPGGRLALCSWAEDGAVTRTLRVAASYLPAPPAFVDPPWLWGSEPHVRELFAGTGTDLGFERGTVELPSFDSADDNIEYHSRRFGPLMAARAAAEADGRWPELRSRLRELHEGLRSAEYLLTLGQRREGLANIPANTAAEVTPAQPGRLGIPVTGQAPSSEIAPSAGT
jgi:SAM-dependent methyltransferase